MTKKDFIYIFAIFAALWVGIESGYRIRSNSYPDLISYAAPEPLNIPGVYTEAPYQAVR